MKKNHADNSHNSADTDKEAIVNTILSETPLKHYSPRPSVFWASGEGPYENTRKTLSNIELPHSKNKRVLLKPNIGRNVAPETGVTTLDAFETSGIAAVAGSRVIPACV